MPVTRHLGEALTLAVGNDRPIIDRTSDRSFENGCVDESGLWMRVGRRRTAGTIFDEHTLDAFARHIWQSVLVDERDLCIFVSGYPSAYSDSADNECAKNKCVDEARQPDRF